MDFQNDGLLKTFCVLSKYSIITENETAVDPIRCGDNIYKTTLLPISEHKCTHKFTF